MGTNLKTKYWVNNVPFWIYPFYLFLSYLLAALIHAYFLIVHLTSRIEWKGDFKRIWSGNSIHCLWHQYSFLYILALFDLRSHVWMAHPYWYMKPALLFFKWRGIEKLVLGSAGTHGREAADEVVQFLKKGYSTLMAPDGPEGPPRILKKGALYMAVQSQVPILPFRFQCRRCFRLKGWDQKIIPLPFAHIRVEIEKVFFVTPENFEEEQRELIEALG